MKYLPLLSLMLVPILSAGDTDLILSMQARAKVRDELLAHRLDEVVPMLMRREGIDMWLISAREYNEDPVLKTMLPATWMSARRRTMLLFYDPGLPGQVERLAVARYDIGKLFKSAWDKKEQPDQLKRLHELIAARKPRKLALNFSPTFALADGISHSEYEAITAVVPKEISIVSGERLAIGWLETRTEAEMALYPQICRIAHQIIAEGFSNRVIQPGITRSDDVVWWYRERVSALKLESWFHPTVAIQRGDQAEHGGDFSKKPDGEVIQHGDLLHVDFGITYLGLNTDTQQMAYVLRPGEEKAPTALTQALMVGNRLQDILTTNFVAGRSGNEILARSLGQASQEGIEATIYTHPIGFHGHGAGPTIGLWDQQGGVPGRGDYPLYARTAHSIELNAAVFIEPWQRKIRIMLEEDAFFDGDQVRYIDGRQTHLILIQP